MQIFRAFTVFRAFVSVVLNINSAAVGKPDMK